jgi:hypothetical protein
MQKNEEYSSRRFNIKIKNNDSRYFVLIVYTQNAYKNIFIYYLMLMSLGYYLDKSIVLRGYLINKGLIINSYSDQIGVLVARV